MQMKNIIDEPIIEKFEINMQSRYYCIGIPNPEKDFRDYSLQQHQYDVLTRPYKEYKQSAHIIHNSIIPGMYREK